MENAGEEPAPLLPVQELAAGRHGAGDDGGVPSRYVARRAHDGSEETPTAAVPVIDLGRLCQPAADGESASEAAKLRAALQSWGLFLGTFM
nr:unnamed protein product [Digitaria exilis]